MRWWRSAIKRALRAWEEFAAYEVAERQAKRAAARRMLNQGISRAWESWQDFLLERTQLRRAALAIMQQGLVRAWRQLVEAHEAHVAAMEVMATVAARLRKSGCYPCTQRLGGLCS